MNPGGLPAKAGYLTNGRFSHCGRTFHFFLHRIRTPSTHIGARHLLANRHSTAYTVSLLVQTLGFPEEDSQKGRQNGLFQL